MTWAAWQLDAPTWAFLGWVGWFVAWESYAIVSDQPLHMWTAHLRPLFLEQPLTWFLGVGLWLWIGVHILFPAVEAWLMRSVQ